MECLNINFQPKKKYAQDGNGKFFCYFGCEPMFDSASELEDHLADSHSAADLKIWGISHLHIAKPDLDLKDNPSEDLNESIPSHKVELEPALQPLSLNQSISTTADDLLR